MHQNKVVTAPPRGVLRREKSEEHYHLVRCVPAPELQPLVEVFWIVQWDLRGAEPHKQENIPDPSIHMILERNKSRIVGLVKGRFERVLEGQGRIFGVKFKPGGFAPFYGEPVTPLTNKTLTYQEAFGVAHQPLESQVMDVPGDDVDAMVKLVEQFLLQRLPPPDPNVFSVQEVMEYIRTQPEVTRVEELVEWSGHSKRQLQRLFYEYIGASPKWVLRMHRLQEALARLEDDQPLNYAALAMELGYYDQSHFIRDFKHIIGASPTEYFQSLVGDS
ncbi:MAG: AraC family transcriptional regulator [Deltaproteobacteria bacterium]|nr:MAG: AraC family transcriptional regulator [Deltaproteobacteria bacterium]